MRTENDTKKTLIHKKRTDPLLVLVTLSLWQIRQVKWIFSVIILGMMVAIILVEAVPLIASVNMTASARAAFTNQPYDPSSPLQISLRTLNASRITQIIQQARQDYQQQGAPFFDLPPDISLHLDDNFFYQGASDTSMHGQLLNLHSYDIAHISSHIQISRGRLPLTSLTNKGTVLEVALTEDTAKAMGARIGSIYKIFIAYEIVNNNGQTHFTRISLPLQIVGILHNLSDQAFDTSFWHGDNLNFQQDQDSPPSPAVNTLIVSNTALLTFFNQFTPQDTIYTSITSNANLFLYFPLDIHTITNTNIDQLQGILNFLTNRETDQLPQNIIRSSSVLNTNLTLMNASRDNQTRVVQIPIISILGLMLGLILFFVTLMTDLLVTRQAEAISILRSRGATALQIFFTFVMQSIFLSLLSILLGSLLVLPVVRSMIIMIHASSNQNALDVLQITPWQVLLTTGWYLWLTVVLAILAMSLAIWRTLRSSLLGRSAPQTAGTQRPFWQRFSADIIFALLAILLYGFSTYIFSTGIVTSQIQVLLLGPSTLATATLLCLAGALFFLRLFPWLVSLATQLTARGSGIVPLFSFVLISRSPRQAMRTLLLLIFTIAFAIFAQVLLATQQQRMIDLANYTTSADFTGQLSSEIAPTDTLIQQEQKYRKIPGTLSATLGYVKDESLSNLNDQLTVIATDPLSFEHSINWPQGTNLQKLHSSLTHLADRQKALAVLEAKAVNFETVSPIPLPAIVSTTTKNLLHLSVGSTFSLASSNSDGQLSLIDIGEVSYLPGVPNITQDQGILVDYDSFSLAYNAFIEQGASLAPTTVWLHTRPDAEIHIQRTLSADPFSISPLVSRHTLQENLQADPLFLNMLSVCILGILLTLLLACIGCLISVWSYIYTRLRSLLTLRALGATPIQLILLFSWEQVIIYGTALVVGIACGVGFTALALPGMVFSDSASLGIVSSSFASNIFQLQALPPLQILVPSSLWLGLAVLILLCIMGIGITTTLILRLSPAQILHSAEDYLEEAPLAPKIRRRLQSGIKVNTSVRQQTGLRYALSLGRILTPIRRAWPLLGLTQLGVLLSVLFVCVVALFSQVTATAGLHAVLTRPENRFVSTTSSSLETVPPSHLQTTLTQATQVIQRTLFGPASHYINETPIISLDALKMTSPQSSSAANLTFDGLPQQNLNAQIQIVQGHIPDTANGLLQIMLTPPAATYLHARIGTMLTQVQGYPLNMQVVGLFYPRKSTENLLSTTDFFFYSDVTKRTGGIITALVTTEGWEVASATAHRLTGNSTLSGTVTWRYALRQTLSGTQLFDLLATLSSVHITQGALHSNSLTLSPIIFPLDALQQYQQSILVATIPIACVSFLIFGLILLFLSFMIDLLVERERNTVAVMRSRGATSRQVFIAFLPRTLLINILAFVGGMGLALPLTTLLAHLILQPTDQNGLSLFSDQPLQTFWILLIAALSCIAITLLAMVLSLLQAIKIDTLSLRREVGRSTRKPLWQRWYLDIIALILALAAYGGSFYLTNTTFLGPEVSVIVKAPLVLMATLFFVIACILLLLRLFPFFLYLGTRLAQRNRGVAPMLALSQLARTPRQSLRTMLLLMMTSAFIVFGVVFAASQNAHVNDVALYWTGTDFGGTLPILLSPEQAAKRQQSYQQIKGIKSATLGDVEAFNAFSNSINATMIAVNPKQFMQTVDWPEIRTPQQRQNLIGRLQNPAQFPDLLLAWSSTPDNPVPALVDAHLWQALQLSPGDTFPLETPQGEITFFAVGEVQSIPTLHDQGQDTPNFDAPSGILVDFQNYNFAYKALSTSHNTSLENAVPPDDATFNSVWLKTDGKVSSQQQVRSVLATGPLQLSAYYDRQDIAQTLRQDPLNLNLLAILALGALVTLVLTWIGCLLASWTDIRQRQLAFGVLRALGSTPGDLTRILAWEQTLIFGTAILLGVGFGLLTAFLALPSLVLTSVLPHLATPGTGSVVTEVLDLFLLQNTPAAQTIIPATIIGVVGILLLLGVIAVIFMANSVSRLSLAQKLRLNED